MICSITVLLWWKSAFFLVRSQRLVRWSCMKIDHGASQIKSSGACFLHCKPPQPREREFFGLLSGCMDGDGRKRVHYYDTAWEFNPRKWAVVGPSPPIASPSPTLDSGLPCNPPMYHTPMHYTTPSYPTLPYQTYVTIPPHLTLPTICHNLREENPTTSLWWAWARRSHAWSLNKYRYIYIYKYKYKYKYI